MDFLSAMFDKRSATNSSKFVVTTILHTPTYPSTYNRPLVMKYITKRFNLRSSKPKLGNAWAVGIYSDTFERLGENTLDNI